MSVKWGTTDVMQPPWCQLDLERHARQKHLQKLSEADKRWGIKWRDHLWCKSWSFLCIEAQRSIFCLKGVCVLFQLPVKVERMSSPCLTSRPAPTWPSLLSCTSRCASALTLRRSSVWDQVSPPPPPTLSDWCNRNDHQECGKRFNETAGLRQAPRCS